jgi:hypothetical protein
METLIVDILLTASEVNKVDVFAQTVDFVEDTFLVFAVASQNVVWFDIQMQVALFMEVSKGSGYLNTDLKDAFHGKLISHDLTETTLEIRVLKMEK